MAAGTVLSVFIMSLLVVNSVKPYLGAQKSVPPPPFAFTTKATPTTTVLRRASSTTTTITTSPSTTTSAAVAIEVTSLVALATVPTTVAPTTPAPTNAPTSPPHSGGRLTASGGINWFHGHRESWYNLPMGQVVANAHARGIGGEYWVRDDGAKMLGNYVMVAADQRRYPYGSLVETSLGTAIVVDTGGFIYSYPDGFDIAVAW